MLGTKKWHTNGMMTWYIRLLIPMVVFISILVRTFQQAIHRTRRAILFTRMDLTKSREMVWSFHLWGTRKDTCNLSDLHHRPKTIQHRDRAKSRWGDQTLISRQRTQDKKTLAPIRSWNQGIKATLPRTGKRCRGYLDHDQSRVESRIGDQTLISRKEQKTRKP